MKFLRKIGFTDAWIFAPFIYAIEKIAYICDRVYGYYILLSLKNADEGCKIIGGGRFLCKERITLGKSVHIGEGALFVAHGGIKVGKHTVISRNCVIRSCDHHYDGEQIPFSNDFVYKSVSIGDGVWIGMNVTINPGVNIGDYAIIATNAVVTNDVPAGEIWGGVPSHKISSRDLSKLKDLASRDKWKSI